MARSKNDALFQEALRVFDPNIVGNAQRLTMTALRSKLRTQVSRATREKFNITAQRLNQALKMTSVDTEGLRSVVLEYTGYRIGLIEFGARFRKIRTVGRRGHLKGVKLRRTGASAKISKGTSPYVVPGGFIASGTNNNVQVFRRINKNDPKSRLEKMTGPSVPQIVGNDAVVRQFDGFVDVEFGSTFQSKLTFLLEKAGR